VLNVDETGWRTNGFVVDTRLEPGARVVTFGNGMVVRERIGVINYEAKARLLVRRKRSPHTAQCIGSGIHRQGRPSQSGMDHGPVPNEPADQIGQMMARYGRHEVDAGQE
jgi:hypothetical protein